MLSLFYNLSNPKDVQKYLKSTPGFKPDWSIIALKSISTRNISMYIHVRDMGMFKHVSDPTYIIMALVSCSASEDTKRDKFIVEDLATRGLISKMDAPDVIHIIDTNVDIENAKNIAKLVSHMLGSKSIIVKGL